MKLRKGNYPGASTFAYFDKPTENMTRKEMQSLLECILHRAMPGEQHAALMERELAIAEQQWKEGGIDE